MAHIDINLNAVDDSNQVHPEGMTHIRVVDSEVKENKAGTGKYIAWKVDVVGSTLKRPIFFNTSLKPEAQAGLKRFLKACKFQWSADGTFDSRDVHGLECMVNVGIREYEGEKQNEVKFPYKEVS